MACGPLLYVRTLGSWDETMHHPNISPEQQTSPYGEWIKASGRRCEDPVDDKLASPSQWRYEPASETEPPRQPSQPRVSVTDLARASPRAPLLTLEPVYPHGKNIPTNKEGIMGNILSQTHEDPPKNTCMVLVLVPTIPHVLNTDPSNACNGLTNKLTHCP